MKALVSLILVVLIAVGAVFALRDDDSAPKSATNATQAGADQTQEDPAEMRARAVMEAKVDKKKKRDLPKKFRLYFPDGTWLPALNGATNPKPVYFRGRPYSPVVRKAYDPKFKRHWYVHADGSWSTTVPMNFRGQKNTVTQVVHPTETQVLLDEGPNGERRVVMPNKGKQNNKKRRAGARGGSKAQKTPK